MSAPEPVQQTPNAFKEGDLLLATTPCPRTVKILLVIRTDPSSNTTHVWEPEFSLNGDPGTYTISGESMYYTPASETVSYPTACEEEAFILQPPAEGAVITVNPPGNVVIKALGLCPYSNCIGHQFCPGCGGVSMHFEHLFMGCGQLLSCPICMGQEFAEKDKGYLLGMENVDYKTPEGKALVMERCNMVDARRAELGYPQVNWVD